MKNWLGTWWAMPATQLPGRGMGVLGGLSVTWRIEEARRGARLVPGIRAISSMITKIGISRPEGSHVNCGQVIGAMGGPGTIPGLIGMLTFLARRGARTPALSIANGRFIRHFGG